jgi:hypothetical protein
MCDHYGKAGHIKSRCYEIVAYPVGYRKHNPSESGKTFAQFLEIAN